MQSQLFCSLESTKSRNPLSGGTKKESMARNLGHQWEVLRFDLPLTQVKFVHAIGWRDIWTTWCQLEQCVLVGRDRSSLLLVLSFAGYFYKVIYSNACRTADTDECLADCVHFWFFALIFAPRLNAPSGDYGLSSSVSHLFNFLGANRLKKRLETRKPG